MANPTVSEVDMFAAIHQAASQIIEQMKLALPTGTFPPTLFIHTLDQERIKEVVMMKRDSLGKTLPDRQLTLQTAGQIFGADPEKEILMIILASMSWGLSKPTNKEAHIRPSDSPRREEIISVTALTVDLKQAMSVIRLDRGARGEMIPLYAEHLSENKPGSSIENNLLPSFFAGYKAQRDQA